MLLIPGHTLGASGELLQNPDAQAPRSDILIITGLRWGPAIEFVNSSLGDSDAQLGLRTTGLGAIWKPLVIAVSLCFQDARMMTGCCPVDGCIPEICGRVRYLAGTQEIFVE